MDKLWVKFAATVSKLYGDFKEDFSEILIQSWKHFIKYWGKCYTFLEPTFRKLYDGEIFRKFSSK